MNSITSKNSLVSIHNGASVSLEDGLNNQPVRLGNLLDRNVESLQDLRDALGDGGGDLDAHAPPEGGNLDAEAEGWDVSSHPSAEKQIKFVPLTIQHAYQAPPPTTRQYRSPINKSQIPVPDLLRDSLQITAGDPDLNQKVGRGL